MLLASAGCVLFATRVFVDFESLRMKAVPHPTAASAGRVEVVAADEKLGTLRAPLALIARIHNDSPAPQEIVIDADGSRVCTATLPGRAGRRFDCAVVRDWAARPDHAISFTGTGEPFTLEYLELATHHGHTTGVLKAVVLPAESRRYVGANGFWLGGVWAALAILLILEPRTFESPTAKSILRVLSAAVVAIFTLVLLSPILSPYSSSSRPGHLSRWSCWRRSRGRGPSSSEARSEWPPPRGPRRDGRVMVSGKPAAPRKQSGRGAAFTRPGWSGRWRWR